MLRILGGSKTSSIILALVWCAAAGGCHAFAGVRTTTTTTRMAARGKHHKTPFSQGHLGLPRLWASGGSDDADVPQKEDEVSEQEMMQFEIDQMTAPPSMQEVDLPPDRSQIPVPMFTAMLVFFGSMYVTGYFFYYGIMGFPTEGELPPLF